MKHAIAELEKSLDTLLHNEPIHRAEGDIETANLEAAKIAEFRDVISLLKAFDHLKDRGWFTPQPAPGDEQLHAPGGPDEWSEPTTIRGWLETLPDGYRERALANTEERQFDAEADDLASALARAFHWVDSPEGHDFWADIRRGEGFPPLPES